ncbi:ABC transporter substrate-binding protein [Novispirillum itersonii]|uniref:Branched-chain amino acid transport system substrate-binding protein n=1 Tax=Novispirillum itersonii TaxID=189 RepID=A0A7X0DKX2_NOVIT|nr:ABC transporter substrate-binding protein [Novispirillum itersonii]MBB6209370.1 branched-chain amino acid transport system substrate-binding protein [Novispirillum itersonii]
MTHTVSVTRKTLRRLSLTMAASALALAAVAPAQAAENGKFRLGIVTFLSGGAAGPFGVPSANAAKVVIDQLNAGALPAPYATKGINGAEIEMVLIDENGGATKQVEEFRNLVQRQKVDAVVGYISSGDCLAVSPVAEELGAMTVFYDCGTSRLFVENKAPKFVFRTGLDAAVDNIGAARYLAATRPNTTRYAGVQQNYSWGQDSWADFTAAMKQTLPKADAVESQMPKLFQGQYGAEISAVSVKRPEIVHSSLWGGDMEAFVLQASARGLLDDATAILTCGESALERYQGQAPNGTIVGARGPFGAFAPQNALNTWFTGVYQNAYQMAPTYPASKMAQAILGLKHAAEKAAKAPGEVPAPAAIAAAFKGANFESVSGTVQMSRADGHQALQGISYGEYHFDAKTKKAELKNVKSFSGSCVTPPDGTEAQDWIKAGFPGAKCE